jgi:predicted TIM-barrel fold metal-dependent hydrolase
MMGTGRTDYGGTPDELLAIMDRAGISHAVMVNMTPVADMMDAALARLSDSQSQAERERAETEAYTAIIGRLRRRNAWTCEVGREHPRLIPFIGLDPGMTEPELLEEIETRRAEGARGIKLHPAAQRFYPNDERLAPVYARAADLGWPVIFHSGAFALGPASTNQASVEHFPPLLEAFPNLTVVLGHMGFGEFETCAQIAAEFQNAMFDCCFAVNGTEPSPAISDEAAVVGFRWTGIDRVMFGSDYPWLDPALDAARINRLPLSEREKRAVLHENAARVFNLSA